MNNNTKILRFTNAAISIRDGNHSLASMIGKTMKAVFREDTPEHSNGGWGCPDAGQESLVFVATTGEAWILTHFQDCCESVAIEDLTDDLGALLGTPMLMAEKVEAFSGHKVNEYEDSYTWTFYKFATIKGYVTVRWGGSSNGYYSETVDLIGGVEVQP